MKRDVPEWRRGFWRGALHRVRALRARLGDDRLWWVVYRAGLGRMREFRIGPMTYGGAAKNADRHAVAVLRLERFVERAPRGEGGER